MQSEDVIMLLPRSQCWLVGTIVDKAYLCGRPSLLSLLNELYRSIAKLRQAFISFPQPLSTGSWFFTGAVWVEPVGLQDTTVAEAVLTVERS